MAVSDKDKDKDKESDGEGKREKFGKFLYAPFPLIVTLNRWLIKAQTEEHHKGRNGH